MMMQACHLVPWSLRRDWEFKASLCCIMEPYLKNNKPTDLMPPLLGCSHSNHFDYLITYMVTLSFFSTEPFTQPLEGLLEILLIIILPLYSVKPSVNFLSIVLNSGLPSQVTNGIASGGLLLKLH